MYSFYCKNCGDFFSSGDKDKVKSYRENHKVKPMMSFYDAKVCPMQKTKRGTLARPSLAIMIDEEEKLKEMEV